MSLISSLIGYQSDGRAAKSISDANIAAENGILTSTKDAQNAVNTSAASGQAGVNTAVDNAGTLINGATGTANKTLANTLGTQTANNQPYQQAGAQGAKTLMDYAASNPQFSFDPSKYVNSDAYNFELQGGQKAIQNSASANGLGQSGAALKALTQYGQGLASTYYQNAFNNAKSTFDTNQKTTLDNNMALINTGEFGTSQQNAAEQNSGNQQATNLVNAGNNLAGVGLQGAEFNSNTGMQAATTAGQEGIAGSNIAGQYAVGAGTAHAGGILGQGNNLASGIGDLSSLAMLFGG